MSENDLRIFLEEYLKTIFAKQYDENDLNSKQLGVRIDELADLNLITESVKSKRIIIVMNLIRVRILSR